MYEEIMNISIKYGTDNIDWKALCEIFKLAPLGTREPDKLKIAAKNSHTVCSAYIEQRIIGFGRAISDNQYQSAIYDVVVLPEFQNHGAGKSIMKALLEKLPKNAPVLIFAVPGKQIFYRKLGFGNLKTGMGLFPNPEMSRAKGYLEWINIEQVAGRDAQKSRARFSSNVKLQVSVIYHKFSVGCDMLGFWQDMPSLIASIINR